MFHYNDSNKDNKNNVHVYIRLAGAPCEREGGLRGPEKDSL